MNDIVEIDTRPRGLAIMHLGINIGLFVAHSVLKITNMLDPKMSFSLSCLFAVLSGITSMLIVPEPSKISDSPERYIF